ncbi:hypothetical protein EGJ28_24215 [Stutzerimonas xanthomarina]|uniref:Uncharacterized protein n=2 Tax=Stutzerimonas TaxID=2901164 RepID=I4CMT9_STUST|nr:hypothetical protein A458_00640 [Stutzerimonas stutzeri CCUG 29243]RRV03352.1 hypothetical protein EGJ28_24215 [Stutzerimonas xanthomarina]
MHMLIMSMAVPWFCLFQTIMSATTNGIRVYSTESISRSLFRPFKLRLNFHPQALDALMEKPI